MEVDHSCTLDQLELRSLSAWLFDALAQTICSNAAFRQPFCFCCKSYVAKKEEDP